MRRLFVTMLALAALLMGSAGTAAAAGPSSFAIVCVFAGFTETDYVSSPADGQALVLACTAMGGRVSVRPIF